MKHESELISDDNGFEILVGYEYEESKQYNDDDIADTMVYTELTSVEVVIAGRGINILHQLHPSQKEFIISKLTY